MLNQVQVIGYVGRIDQSKNVATFSVGVTERGYTNKAGKEVPEHTEWFNCVAFGKQAEFAVERIAKGSFVYVLGRMVTEEYESKEGSKKTSTKLYVERILALRDAKTDGGIEQIEVNANEKLQDMPF